MPNFNFDWKTFTFSSEGISMDSLSAVPGKLLEIIKNPSSNVPAAILMLAIVIVFIIVIALTVVAWFSRPKDPVIVESYLVETPDVDENGNPIAMLVEEEVGLPKDPSRKYYVFLTLIIMLVIMWVVTGITTQVKPVCISCHVNDPHVAEMESDPHNKTRCVSCHEDNGLLGSVTTGVPLRMAHIVVGTFKKTEVPGYASFPARSCANFHKDVVAENAIVTDEESGIIMSHYEPDQAGVACADCHVLDADKKVTATSVGMQPCLRCHNDIVTSSDCETCHGLGEKVVASSEPSPDNAQTLVNGLTVDQRCYDCHNPKPCDSCHAGLRMPHPGGPEGYMMNQHASDAKKYGVNACYKCHNSKGGTATPCSECHDEY